MTKRNKVERMTIANTLLTSIYEELLNGETDDVEGLLQIAVNGQVEMDRIVFELNQLNGCEPQTELKGSKRLVKGSEEETEIERLDRIDSEIEDAWARIRELTPLDEPQTDCAWK